MKGRRLAQAAAVLDGSLDVIRHASGREIERLGPLDGRVVATDRMPVHVRMVPSGRVFGGTVDLELATATPVMPKTRGISGRGRGLVRMRGVSFHGAHRDHAGQRVAARLTADAALVQTLSAVHFQQVRVDAGGRAVVRHIGGCLVWMLLPPMTRPVPLIPEQALATLTALEAFADAGARINGGDHPVVRSGAAVEPLGRWNLE